MTMTLAVTDVATIPRIDHDEAMVLAETEFARALGLLRTLGPEEWHTQTVCEFWDVRSLVAHVLGMAEAQASFRQFVHDFRAASKRSGGAMIDAMTAAQVRERAELAPTQLIERLADVAPAAVRARRRTPALVRWAVRMKQDPPFEAEHWKYGYLVDTIFTRDTWMHRLDISRATGRQMVLTPKHDGRLIAEVVAEWARRHRQPFTLILTGPAGGQWRSGTGGQHIELDALEFGWSLAGRARGAGLLTTRVPF
jgi:uncharacterized protein (TIGR03083 family)